MRRFLTSLVLASLATGATGCIVYETDVNDVSNYSPTITWAEAGCFWDSVYGDYVWYFDTDVDDPNGPGDIKSVYADVYDSWSGEWVDSFELYKYGRYNWYSDWLQASTWLDCTYPDYVVDFVAYDYQGKSDLYSVYPYTY